MLTFASVEDITSRVLSMEALERIVQDFADAQQIAQVGSWRWDPRTDELRVSPQMYRLWGLEPGNGRETNDMLTKYVHPDDLARVHAADRDAANVGESYLIEYRITGADGVERMVREIGHQDPEDPYCLVGTIQDITGHGPLTTHD